MVELEFGVSFIVDLGSGGTPWCLVTRWWLVAVMCALEKGVVFFFPNL